MATMQDVWNEVDKRDQATFDAVMAAIGASSASASGGTGAPPASAGGLPVHNNLHHQPPLAIASDLDAHIATIASDSVLGHIRVGDGLAINGDGILSVVGEGLLSFLDLTDTPDAYTGQGSKVVRVKSDVTGLEFHALTAADVGALTQAVADTLYDPLGAAADAIADHVAESDPHPQYLTTAEADALFLTPAEGNAAYATIDHVQAVDKGGTNLTSIAQDNILYSSAANVLAATPITTFGRSLIDDADAAAARTTLGLAAGGAGDIWVQLTGDTMSGDLSISKANASLTVQSTSGGSGANLNVRADAGAGNANLNFDGGSQVQMNWRRLVTGTPTLRWVLLMSSTTESGSNAGSNFGLLRRTDAGGSLGDPVIAIERATGFIGINRPEAEALYSVDIDGTFRVDSSTGGTATLFRTGNATSGVRIGRIDFANDDGDLTTQNIYGYIEVQAAATISTDAARGKMLFAVTPNTVASSPVVRLTIEEDGRIHGSALHNNAGAVTGTTNQYIASGTYTPTLNNTTNVAGSTAYVCQWIRVGNVVTVSGKVDVDPTAAAATVLGISLPIASNLANLEDCAGTAASPAVANLCAAIVASIANDRAEMQWVAVDTANRSWYFTFTYEVL